MKTQDDAAALDREHRSLCRVTAFVYVGGGVLFIVAIGLIMRMSSGPAFVPAQWFLSAIWLAALVACGRCADRGLWIFRLLGAWEESIARRRRALDDQSPPR